MSNTNSLTFRGAEVRYIVGRTPAALKVSYTQQEALPLEKTKEDKPRSQASASVVQ